MSRREFFANSSVDAVRSFLKVVEEGSEVKSTSFCVETPQPLSHSSFSMCTKLPQEVSTLQVKDPLRLVSQYTLPKTQRQEKSYWRAVLLCSLTAVFAASTSSTKWMTALV